jgi:hypothetical protein
MEAVWFALGGNVVFLAVVAFLGKGLITHWLDKDIGRFKQQLQHDAATEIERLRGSLQIAATEHSILLSRLQDRRADVIDTLYALLAKAISATASLLAVFEPAGALSKDEKSKLAYEANVAVRDYCDQKRVWLPAECCEQVDALLEQLRKLYMDFEWDRRQQARGDRTDPNKWHEAFVAINEKLVPPVRKALERELRSLLEPPRAVTKTS